MIFLSVPLIWVNLIIWNVYNPHNSQVSIFNLFFVSSINLGDCNSKYLILKIHKFIILNFEFFMIHNNILLVPLICVNLAIWNVYNLCNSPFRNVYILIIHKLIILHFEFMMIHNYSLLVPLIWVNLTIWNVYNLCNSYV